MAVKLRNAPLQKDLTEPLIKLNVAVLLSNRTYMPMAGALKLHLPVIIEKIDDFIDHDL